MSSNIDNAPAHVIVEAGLNVLSDQLEIDSPDDVAEKISEHTWPAAGVFLSKW